MCCYVKTISCVLFQLLHFEIKIILVLLLWFIERQINKVVKILYPSQISLAKNKNIKGCLKTKFILFVYFNAIK